MKRLTKALIGAVLGTVALGSVVALSGCEHKHDWATDYTVDKAPTCTVDGSKSIHCSGCDEVKDVTPIPAGHVWADDYTVDTPAGCTTDGSKSKHCTVDGCDGKTDVTAIPAGHTWALDFTVDTPATCLGEGSKSKHCDNCDEVKEVTPIPANGHDFEEEYTIDEEPTCTVKGSKSYHCKNCEATDGATFVDELGHVAGEWTVEDQNLPSLTSGGKATAYCTREGCDALVAEHDLPALTSEDYASEVVTPSTCTTIGEATYVYNKDGVTVTFTGGVDLAPHQYGDTLDLTGKTKGDIVGKTCGVCGSPDVDNSYVYMDDSILSNAAEHYVLDTTDYYFQIDSTATKPVYLRLDMTKAGTYEITFDQKLDTNFAVIAQVLLDGSSDTANKVAQGNRVAASVLDPFKSVATIENNGTTQTTKFTFDASDAQKYVGHYLQIMLQIKSSTFVASVDFEPAPAPKIVLGTALSVSLSPAGDKTVSEIKVDDSIADGTYVFKITLKTGNLRTAYILMQVNGEPEYDDMGFDEATFLGEGVALTPGQFVTNHPDTYTGTSTYQAVYTVTTTLKAGDTIYFATTGLTAGDISVTLTAA